MDDLTKLASEQNATLVVLSFLQADCSNVQYNKAVYSLGKELTETWRNSCEDNDGVIECDCNLPGTIEGSIADIEPLVELYWPGGVGEARALQVVAAQLREIAAQLEQNVVDQSARNLHNNVMSSPSEQWLELLKSEVHRAMMQGVGLDQLPRERVIMALSLTLVKQVCEHTPQLLRDLFNTALQYISPTRAR
ncbi:BH3 interacting domain death agonist [Hippocampus comes]|uniref:BH3 interacting domain death agonist n=1 Tax=Hippocampus comes TaxID=109280 RepID=UPI00094F2451|nr:PREDICTED: BH3-interacting domain death agonist [Hippocampus comes]XP_019749543.1 PREDICTED: BH3-interacting domain death agonist [Hippocampus comes]XP_019749544.1 PREDICTED: BH3-interacting domain death agonist [Hippocampus comes]XP_019749545.1 PREDICTED: BH3-interacting domain death agonist [Hippocampus comes]